MAGFTVNTSAFDRATKALQEGVKKNTQTYGRTLAQTFETTARGGAPWVDRRGNARPRLYGTMTASGNKVRVDMGGSAPNYKHSALSAKDYLEYLEFAHGKKYAIVVPTAEMIYEDVQQNFGQAALYGNHPKVMIQRNRNDLNQRRKAILTQTAVGAWTMMEAVRYQQWLADRSVFNG